MTIRRQGGRGAEPGRTTQNRSHVAPSAGGCGDELAAAEFFAGMGLVRRALEAEAILGEAAPAPGRRLWRTVFANDYDPMKRRIYSASFDDADSVLNGDDIGELSCGEIPRADLWTASFPCTDLSLAGRGLGIHAGQSGAVWHLLRLLEETPDQERPAHLLFENVMGLLSSHGGADFRALVEAVNRLGYGVDPVCVNASCFVPQSRARLFLLCARLEMRSIADPETVEPCSARPARIVSAMRRSADLLWHARPLPALPTRRTGLDQMIEDVPDDSPLWWAPKRAEYFLGQVHPEHLATARALINGERVSHTPAFRRVREVMDANSGVKKKRSVIELRTDGLAGCLRTPKGGSARQIVLKAGRGAWRVRLMTPLECARLQGVDELPDGFRDIDLQFGLGDAVCVPAVRWALDRLTEGAVETRENTKATQSLFSASA
ncbi:MAG: DNA cytosine methyltransferase [Phycisphaeraceae bacterium]|nr:MAG: DNA cytosine methyltransferase [Phycisphaeraceae bacterium]